MYNLILNFPQFTISQKDMEAINTVLNIITLLSVNLAESNYNPTAEILDIISNNCLPDTALLSDMVWSEINLSDVLEEMVEYLKMLKKMCVITQE